MPPRAKPTPPAVVVHSDKTVHSGAVRGLRGSASSAAAAVGPSLISKVFAELTGTALLTFTVAVAAGQGSTLAAIGIGSTLMCIVYAGGHVSGM